MSNTTQLAKNNQDVLEKQLFMCATCDLVFDNITVLRRHKKNVHSKISPYPSRNRGQIRRVQVDENSYYTCSFCPYGYRSKHYREIHEKRHHSGLCPYTCNFCWCSFNNSAKLKSHIIHFHNEIKDNFDIDASRIGTNVSIRKSIAETKETVIEETTMRRSSRKSSKSLDAENEIVIRSSPVIMIKRCKVDSEASDKSQTKSVRIPNLPRKQPTLEELPNVKSSETPGRVKMYYANELFCAYCPKFFSTKESRQRHELIHTGNWLYSCRFCKVTFLFHKTSEAHKRFCRTLSINSHFWCNYCDYHSLREEGIDVHKKKKHGLKDSQSLCTLQPRSKFVCDICDASFALESTLNRHKWKSHRKTKVKQRSVVRKFKKIILPHTIEESTIFQREKKNQTFIPHSNLNLSLAIEENDSSKTYECHNTPVKMEKKCLMVKNGYCVEPKQESALFDICCDDFNFQSESSTYQFEPLVKLEDKRDLGSIENELEDPLK